MNTLEAECGYADICLEYSLSITSQLGSSEKNGESNELLTLLKMIKDRRSRAHRVAQEGVGAPKTKQKGISRVAEDLLIVESVPG